MPKKDKEATTMEWITQLPMEMSLVTLEECIDPGEDIYPNEFIVGEMTDEHKRLYTLGMEARNQAIRLGAEMEISTNKQKRLELEAETQRFVHKAAVLKELFFYELNSYFNLWNKNSVAVRTGFKVVWSDEQENPLKRLFGGGL